MSNSNSKSDEREFESNARTQKQKNDPLTEYNEKEPMTPAKIKEHEPTAVKRDSNDQTIVRGGGQTGTDSPEALEEYRRKGITKVSDDNDYNRNIHRTATISSRRRRTTTISRRFIRR